MATHKKVGKKYLVNKRFEVWASMEIAAGSFDEAVIEGRKLRLGDLFDKYEGVELISDDELPGFGVTEGW